MKIFNILDKYILSETIVPFFINLLFFSILFIMRHLLQISDLIVNHKTSVSSVCLMVIYAMPYFLQYIIPISITAAILIVCIRMLDANEILVLKISGTSIYRFVKPVVFLGFVGVFITGIITLYTLPMSEKALKSLSRKIVFSSLGLKERFFNDEFENTVIYIGQLDRGNGNITDIFVEESKTDNVCNMVIASRGQILNVSNDMSIHVRLFSGSIIKVDSSRKLVEQMNFDECDVFFHIGNDVFLNKPDDINNINIKELNFVELKDLIASVKISSSIYHEALVQYHKIFAIPFSCLFMGIMALSLGVYKLKLNSFFASSLAVTFFLVYYVLLSTGIHLSKSSFFHPLIGIWFPNILLGLVSLIFLIKANRR